MSAPLPLLKMDKRSEPTMNHTSWRCIFKISAESGGVHGSGHWVSSSALPGVSIVIIIININHHHIIWIIFPWLYLTLNLNLFNVEAMFGSCCWSKCLLCFRKAFYILYILKEEEDFEFSGLSYLTKTVNFKQECLDECYKRFLRDITSQIGHSNVLKWSNCCCNSWSWKIPEMIAISGLYFSEISKYKYEYKYKWKII